VQFNANHLHDDLQKNLRQLPFNEALNAFIAQHPDATPYTVFQTKTAGNTVPPATAGAMNFMDTHKGFMDAHKMAGSFFLPQPDTSGDFNLAAYQEQLHEGMRIKKTPQEFANDVIYAMSAKTFFDQDDLYHQMIAGLASNSAQRQTLDQQWKAWSNQFLAVNPIFADQMASSTGSTTRAQVMHDVAAALSDPRLPGGSTTDNVRTLYQQWQLWQNMVTTTGGTNAPHLSSAAKAGINLQFAQWADGFAKDHPDVQALYNKAIRPGFTPTIQSQLAGEATT